MYGSPQPVSSFSSLSDRVETIGDCYVAVTGLPRPTKSHAVIMTRFANDCLKAMAKLTRQLESVLGPDTADLQLRIGLHSGPVTAGGMFFLVPRLWIWLAPSF